MTAPDRIMTIGHSTRTAEQFVALLQAHQVGGVADVRRFAQSRRHPHFAKDALASLLAVHGIAYQHFPGLGGMRKPQPDSPNAGWRHASFRAYADYMGRTEFEEAIEALLAFAQKILVAVMCAESQWWQCHRQLVADALVVRGIEVRHIMAAGRAPAHELTSFARADGHRLHYPGLL